MKPRLPVKIHWNMRVWLQFALSIPRAISSSSKAITDRSR